MLSLAFCWGILPLMYFAKQATTGWLEAVVGTNWGGRSLFLLKQLALRTTEFLERSVEQTDQTYAVIAHISRFARSFHQGSWPMF